MLAPQARVLRLGCRPLNETSGWAADHSNVKFKQLTGRMLLSSRLISL